MLRWRVLVAGFVLASCGTHPTKPAAPVEVRLDARPLAGGWFELDLQATPTVAVDWLELRLEGRRAQEGPLAAGATIHLTARTRGNRDVVGSATTTVGSSVRSRAVLIRIGPPRALATVRESVITLPGGERVAEMRP